MPNSISPQEKLVFWFDSLLYAANHTFITGRRGPRAQGRRMNRIELVALLRNHVTPVVQVPVSGSATNRDLYHEMVSLIQSLRDTTTRNFQRRRNAETREQFVDDFVENTMHPMFAPLGCGDLCYDKERGCVEC